jgi:hypothetical protein
MVAKTQLRYSQRETQIVPKTQLSALSQLSKTPSVELSSSEDGDGDSNSSRRSSTKSSTDNDNPNHEPRRSGRVKRPTRNAASQASHDRVAALAHDR